MWVIESLSEGGGGDEEGLLRVLGPPLEKGALLPVAPVLLASILTTVEELGQRGRFGEAPNIRDGLVPTIIIRCTSPSPGAGP